MVSFLKEPQRVIRNGSPCRYCLSSTFTLSPLSLSLALSFHKFQHGSDPVTSMETQPWHVFRLKLSWQWLSSFNFFPPSLLVSLSFPSPVSYTILFSPDRVSSHGSLPKTCCFLLLHPVTGNLLWFTARGTAISTRLSRLPWTYLR